MKKLLNKKIIINKKFRAFTLIELIVTITVLSIILLIAAPIVIDLIGSSRIKVNINNTLSIVKSVGIYTSEYADDDTVNHKFNGGTNILDDLNLTGKRPDGGYVTTDEEGNVEAGVIYDGKCYIKKSGEYNVTVSDNLDDCKFISIETIKDVITGSDNIIQNENGICGTDYRFAGTDVNNYVTFNNETWRMIGYVNCKVKLIEENYSTVNREWDWGADWNETEDCDLVSSDWTKSTTLRSTLEDKYDTLSEEAQKMVATVSYNLGVVRGNSYNLTKEQIYAFENDMTSVYGFPTKIDNARFALAYASDFLFSVKDDDSWMYNGDYNEWLLTSDNNQNYCSGIGGSVYILDNEYKEGLYSEPPKTGFTGGYRYRHVFYLNDNVKIRGGEGTKDNPYNLVIQ